MLWAFSIIGDKLFFYMTLIIENSIGFVFIFCLATTVTKVILRHTVFNVGEVIINLLKNVIRSVKEEPNNKLWPSNGYM